jgi:hypothetical protein
MKNVVILALSVLLIVILISCDEPMPSRNDPGGVLTATFDAQYCIKIFQHFQQNAIRVRLVVRNVYDETLQDKAIFKNSFKITLPRERMIQKSFQFTPEMLKESWRYDRVSGLLTLNPGDTATFTYYWEFIDDAGINLVKSVFLTKPDVDCPGRITARREDFLIGGTFRLYQTIGADFAFTQRQIPVCWVSIYDPNCAPTGIDCPPMLIVRNYFD